VSRSKTVFLYQKRGPEKTVFSVHEEHLSTGHVSAAHLYLGDATTSFVRGFSVAALSLTIPGSIAVRSL
jgi:hypothetical protein